MNKLPTPPPDRRLENKKKSYLTKSGSDYNINSSDPNNTYSEKDEVGRFNNINMHRLKTIEDMRKNLLTYKVNCILFRS